MSFERFGKRMGPRANTQAVSQTRSITRLVFGRISANYFDSAALGIWPEPRRVEADVQFDWDVAVGVVQQKFSKLVGQPSHTISVFHNTTAGVQRILLRLSHLLGSSDATLLLSDLEYPGIVSAVDETWTGRVIMTQVTDLIWMGEAHKVTERLEKSILASRPSVVYLSHVARATGYRVSESLIDFIRGAAPRTVIVLDGAQACGNIHIDPDLLHKIDFYVTSGHKWLCGKQTLGLVYAQEKWGLKDPAQSYSMTRGSTGTGSRDVILSLQRSLSDFNGEFTGQTAKDRMQGIEEHNANLARYFSSQIKKKRLGKPVAAINQAFNEWRWNGIVTVVFDSQDMVQRLQGSKFRFTTLGDESWRDNLGAPPPGRRYFLDPDKTTVFEPANFRQAYVPKVEGYPARFCFHFYHNKNHVDQLVSQIETVKRELLLEHRQ